MDEFKRKPVWLYAKKYVLAQGKEERVTTA
jgi:hypothetical protein